MSAPRASERRPCRGDCEEASFAEGYAADPLLDSDPVALNVVHVEGTAAAVFGE